VRPFARLRFRQIRIGQAVLYAVLDIGESSEEAEIRTELMGFGQCIQSLGASSEQTRRVGQADERRRRDFTDGGGIDIRRSDLPWHIHLTNHTGHVVG
jgi:hypothetical protein